MKPFILFFYLFVSLRHIIRITIIDQRTQGHRNASTLQISK